MSVAGLPAVVSAEETEKRSEAGGAEDAEFQQLTDDQIEDDSAPGGKLVDPDDLADLAGGEWANQRARSLAAELSGDLEISLSPDGLQVSGADGPLALGRGAERLGPFDLTQAARPDGGSRPTASAGPAAPYGEVDESQWVTNGAEAPSSRESKAPGRKFSFGPAQVRGVGPHEDLSGSDALDAPSLSSVEVLTAADGKRASALDGLIRLVRPASIDRGSVSLVTAGAEATEALSSVGLAFSIEADGGAKPSAETVAWELRFGFELFPGQDPSAIQFVENERCSQAGGCQSGELLAARVDYEAEEVVLELPRQLDTIQSAGGAGATIIGVNVSAGGAQGSYNAAAFESVASWQVGLPAGTAQLSYRMSVPSAPGPVPDLVYAYSSASVDGMTAASNNQASQVGLGWSNPVPVISRSLKVCEQNERAGLCFAQGSRHDGFNLSFAGVRTPLVRLSDSGRSHPQVAGATYWAYSGRHVDGLRVWRVEQGPGTEPGNNDHWTTWWEVTTSDGTLWVFGRERVFKPVSGSSGPAPTRARYALNSNGDRYTGVLRSAQTVPVHVPGEGCPANWCDVAMSWFADQAIDVSGNMAVYHYDTESNFVEPLGTDKNRWYERALHVAHIDYGLTFGDGPRLRNQSAPYRVLFQEKYGRQDVPALECPSEGPCDQESPSFYTKRLLEEVSVLADGTQKMVWNLWYNPFGQAGDKLTLRGIQREGLPPVLFDYVNLENRVNGPSLTLPRVLKMTTEAGASVNFSYGQGAGFDYPGAPTDYVPSDDPGDVCYRLRTDNAVRRPCDMFVRQEGDGYVWYNKWKVHQQAVDPGDGGLAMVTKYRYPAPPHWAHNQGENEDDGTWSDFRGYPIIDVYAPDGTRTRHFFYTGMFEDHRAAGDAQPLGFTAEGVHTNPWGDEFSTSDPARKNLFALTGRTSGSIRYVRTVPGAWTAVEAGRTVHRYYLEAESGTVERAESVVKWPYRKTYRVRQQITNVEIFNDPRQGDYTVRTKTVNDFDYLGRPTVTVNEGGIGRSDQERTSLVTYAHNPNREIATGLWTTGNQAFVGLAQGAVPTIDSSHSFVSASSFEYDGFGRMRAQYTQRKQGDTWPKVSMTYNERGLVSSETRHGGAGSEDDQTTRYTYSSFGTPTSVDGPLAGTVDRSEMAVDPAFGVTTWSKDPDGAISETEIDSLGRPTKVWLPHPETGASTRSGAPFYTIEYGIAQGSVDWAKTNTLFDTGQYAQAWSFTDGLGRTIQTQSEMVALNSQWQPEKRPVVTSTAYDGAGRVAVATNPRDVEGHPAGQFKDEEWNDLTMGHSVSTYPIDAEVRSAGIVDRGCTDGDTVVVDRIDPTVTADYDGDGEPDRNWSTSVSTQCGLIARSWDPGGRYGSTTSDVWGNQVSSVERINNKDVETLYRYNVRNELTEIIGVDKNGNADPGENKTQYAYDRWESAGPTWISTPGLGAMSLAYDGHGRLGAVTDARNITLGYVYDNLNRPTELNYDRGESSTQVSSWTWDTANKFGQLARSTHNNVDLNGASAGRVEDSFWYDKRGRLTSETFAIPGMPGGNKQISYGLFEGGAARAVYYPDAPDLYTSLNDVGQARWVGFNDSGNWRPVVRDVKYNPWGRPLLLKRAESNRSREVNTYYQYEENKAGWLEAAYTERRTAEGGVSPQQFFKYRYGPDGRLWSIHDESAGYSAATQCFGYDNAHRVTKAWTHGGSFNCDSGASDGQGPEPYESSWAYNYDHSIAGAWGHGTVGGSYRYDNASSPHAATTAGGNSYRYDPTGNRVSQTVNGEAAQFSYGVLGRMRTATADGTVMLYNAGGERRKRSTSAGTDFFLGAGFQLDGSGRETISVSVAGELAGTYKDGGVIWTQAVDHLGSPVYEHASAAASGVTRRYTPFGMPRPATVVPGQASDVGFTGQRLDAGTGLMYYGARYYDPQLGQFAQPDPLTVDGLNRYTYVRNNPIRFTDPSGLCAEQVADCQVWANAEFGAFGPMVSGYNNPYGRGQSWAPSTGFEQGVADGVRSGTSGLVHVATNPIQTGRGLYAVANSCGVAMGAGECLLLRSLQAQAKSFNQNRTTRGTPYALGHVAGEGLVGYATGRASGAAVGVAGRGLAGSGRITNDAPPPIAPRAGLGTQANEAVFWSGIRGGDATAANWVAKNGGSTLESTLASRGINLPAWDSANPATVAAWRNASREFAEGASGNVRVLQTDAVRVNSVWAEVEFPALTANTNVTSITAVNPNTGAEVLLWSR